MHNKVMERYRNDSGQPGVSQRMLVDSEMVTGTNETLWTVRPDKSILLASRDFSSLAKEIKAQRGQDLWNFIKVLQDVGTVTLYTSGPGCSNGGKHYPPNNSLSREYITLRDLFSAHIIMHWIGIFPVDSVSILSKTVPRGFLRPWYSKQEHIVVDTLLPMMFLGLHKLGNICGVPDTKFVSTRNSCAWGQTGKQLCPQRCVPVCLSLQQMIQKF